MIFSVNSPIISKKWEDGRFIAWRISRKNYFHQGLALNIEVRLCKILEENLFIISKRIKIDLLVISIIAQKFQSRNNRIDEWGFSDFTKLQGYIVFYELVIALPRTFWGFVSIAVVLDVKRIRETYNLAYLCYFLSFLWKNLSGRNSAFLRVIYNFPSMWVMLKSMVVIINYHVDLNFPARVINWRIIRIGCSRLGKFWPKVAC